MTNMLVQYKVKIGRAAENEAFISRVFEQLEEQKPSGIRYASFKLADGVSFIHFVSVETADGANPLCELSAFNAFTKSSSDRIDGEVVVTQLRPFRSYRVFGEPSS